MKSDTAIDDNRGLDEEFGHRQQQKGVSRRLASVPWRGCGGPIPALFDALEMQGQSDETVFEDGEGRGALSLTLSYRRTVRAQPAKVGVEGSNPFARSNKIN